MKVLNTLNGLKEMASNTRIFNPEKHFKGKRVAIIGAADSAFEKENGSEIDGFDYIVRINKAPHSLTPQKYSFIGSRTDILFHSFYENTDRGGGGPINWGVYDQQGVKYLINPNTNFKGIKAHLNYFKRNSKTGKTYLLPRSTAKAISRDFGNWIPTVGYSALYSILRSGCIEVYITGFTFFKTPYADDYRDDLKDVTKNNKYIKEQGFHNPDLELKEFLHQLEVLQGSETKITMDDALKSIVNTYKKQ